MKARVPLAALVLFLGVGGLLAAWWVSARRALDAEVRLQSQLANRAAMDEERGASERLRRRLEELRAAESQRPYFHYQNLYHDPKGASQGLSVVPSPLAAGPQHPLVTAHFQIDAKGRVSLPTLNEELRELSAPNAAEQRAVRDRLAAHADAIRGSVAALVSELDREAAEERAMNARIAELENRLAEARAREARALAATRLDEARRVAERNLSSQRSTVQRLDPAAFAQNVAPNEVYTQLKQNAPAAAVPRKTAKPVDIRTTPLEWRTLTIAGKPTLVALRAVQTPDGVLVQGMLTPVVDGGMVEGAVVSRASTGTPIEGTGWRARLPHPHPQSATRDAERERFTRTFGAVAAVLLLVVIGVIWTLTRVERLAADRARFAATAAHELRTPLASLRLFSELIAEEEDPAKREQYAREISGQTERLGRVVANVLEVTRLERGSFALAPRPGEIGRAVADCVARLEPQLAAARCPIDLRVAPDLPEVAFDPDALHHVVDNLVDNAEKFSRDVPGRSISVDVAPEQGGVAITVSDRGPGVPEELVREPRPFRRGTSGIAGLGLGLFLVERIVRGHGGALRSMRREGGGASVRVFLPAFYKP